MMDERTDKRFNNKLSFSSSSSPVLLRLYMYAVMLCYQPRRGERERRRVIDAESLPNSIQQRINSLLSFFSCAVLDNNVQKILFVAVDGVASSPRFSFSLHSYSFIITHTQVFPFYTHSIIGKVEKNTKKNYRIYPMNFPRVFTLQRTIHHIIHVKIGFWE